MFRFYNLGLRLKIFVLLAVTTLTALVLACAAFVVFDQFSIRKRVAEDLQRDAGHFAEVMATFLLFDTQDGIEDVISEYRRDPHLVAGVVYNAAGEVFFSFAREDVGQSFKPPPMQDAATAFSPKEYISIVRTIGTAGDISGKVFLLRDLVDVWQRAKEFISIAAAVVGVSFVVALMISFRLQQHITEPLLSLSQVANNVARNNDYTARVTRYHEDEIGQLVDDFNEMLAQIQTHDVALQMAYDDLEKRVQERTAELSKTNNKLMEEISTREWAEDEMRKSQQKLLLHMKQTPLGVIDWNKDGEVISWNPAAEKIFGWREHEVIGQSWRDFLVPPAAMEKASANWTLLQNHEGGGHVILKNITRDERMVMCEWFHTPLVNEQENVVGIASLVQDITQRVQSEIALKQSEERFSKVFRASPAAVGIVTLPDGRFIDVNNRFLEDFGHERESIIGKTARELKLWSAEADEERLFKLVQEMTSVSDFDCPLKTSTGEVHNTLLSAELVTLGDRICVLLQVHDLTERMNLESQLRQAQKMEAIGQFAAGVAHDFNNILTIIQGHTNLLQVTHPKDHEDFESVREIGLAADRAANLTRQLLAFSRKQVMRSRMLDLNEVVNNSSKMLTRLVGDNIQVTTRLSETPALAKADIGMIEQVILNLAVNARDAMENGGALKVRTQWRAFNSEQCEMIPDAEPGEYVELTVADTGMGMDKTTLSRIFDPFFTTKEVGKGTGLGLAMVYGIVKQHSGWLSVESEPGAGTMFRIYFPAAGSEQRKTASERHSDRNAEGGKEGILVTEDEPSLRKMMIKMLRHYGYRVFSAEHGVEALAVWAEHKSEIELLLTDMVMPEGISGRDLALKIRKENAELKVIYTSGYSPELFGKDVGLDEQVNFLPKPYRMNTLALLVRQVLDGDPDV
jgi:two-component system cell cycle sensor histidine kinase/response regulator CckA